MGNKHKDSIRKKNKFIWISIGMAAGLVILLAVFVIVKKVNADTVNSNNLDNSVIASGADPTATLDGLGEDSTEAFQYAVDHYEVVIIPEGSYRIDGQVVIKKPVKLIGQGGIIYANPSENGKKSIFTIEEGGSGSSFESVEVRSYDKYVADMPADEPVSLTSNKIFVDVINATDITISDCTSYNMMSAINGVGMDRIVIEDCNFKDSYIGIWIGDTEDIMIKDSYFSTSRTADLYAHCIYIGYNTRGITIKDITLEQKSEAGGAFLNFAWVEGDEDDYYIHDVMVDGVTIVPSVTINYVVQCIGVENAVFRNINGEVKANSIIEARNSLYRGGNSNGSIEFKECDIKFEELTTFISHKNNGTSKNKEVKLNQCTFDIVSMKNHFIQSYVQSLIFEDCELNFEKATFSEEKALYQSCISLKFIDTTISWTSDLVRLCNKIENVDNYDVEVEFDSCTFNGDRENTGYYILNGITPHKFTFINNICVNLVNREFETDSIKGLVDEKYLEEFTYVYDNNTFTWN